MLLVTKSRPALLGGFFAFVLTRFMGYGALSRDTAQCPLVLYRIW